MLSLLKKFRLPGLLSKRDAVDAEGFSPYLKPDDAGVGVIEVILILLVLVGLVIIFRNQITSLAYSIFSSITDKTGTV